MLWASSQVSPDASCTASASPRERLARGGSGTLGLWDSGTLGLMWRQCPDFIIALAGLTGSGGRFATP